MKIPKFLVVIVAAAALGGTVVVSIAFANSQKSTRLEACKTLGVEHTVIISSSKVNPEHVDAKHCDRLRIVNHDDIIREIGFGNHDHHVAYDGITEKIIQKGQDVTVTLVQTGEYHFHDHFHDEVAGSFTVRE